jgi:hypothetical protein
MRMSNSYDLVFINGCKSADPDSIVPVQFVEAFNAQAYVGWTWVTNVKKAAQAAQPFFLGLHKRTDYAGTVSDAVSATGADFLTWVQGGGVTVDLTP